MRKAMIVAAGSGLLVGSIAQAQSGLVFYMDFDDNVQVKGNPDYATVQYELYGNAQYDITLAPVLKTGKSVFLPQDGSRDAVGPAGLNAATTEAQRRAFFDSLANVPNIGTSLTGSWTMEAWVKPSSTDWPMPLPTNEGTVINLTRNAGDTWLGDEDPYLWGYGSRSNSISAVNLSNNPAPHAPGHFQGRAYLGNPTNPNHWYPSEGTYENVLSESQSISRVHDWKHVALVFDADALTLQMYVNGQPSGSAVAVTDGNLFTSFSQTDGLFPIIGADKYNAPASGDDTLWHTFEGYIDQPALWSEVVTPKDPRSGFQGVIGGDRLAGDANFDGIVDLSDLSIMAGRWDQAATYGLADADFNIDGMVDLSDLSILAGNWGAGSASQSMSFDEALQMTGLSDVVPEPAGLGILAAAALGMTRRRRRA